MTSGEKTDAEIVESILAGRTEEFEELVRRYRRQLVGAIFRHVRNYDVALEISQDVFIKIYGALDRYNPEYKFSTWIFRIATNASIDYLRKRRLQTISISPADDDDGRGGMDLESKGRLPDQDFRNLELRKALESEINALSDDYRELISLRHFGELSYDEIAQLKDMPIGTVKNKIFRARVILRQRLRSFLEP